MEDRIGIDFSSSGSVLTKSQLEEQRRKRGECLTCGQKCFQKRLFKMIPLTIHGSVLNGRCLKCKPLDIDNNDTVLPAVSRPATLQDLDRFTRSQSSLQLNGPGVTAPRRAYSSHSHRSDSANNMARGQSVASLTSRDSRGGMARIPDSVDEGGARSDDEDTGYRSSDGGVVSPRRTRSGRVPGRTMSTTELREDHHRQPPQHHHRQPDRSVSSRESTHHDSPQAAAPGLQSAMDYNNNVASGHPPVSPMTDGEMDNNHNHNNSNSDPLRRAMIGGMAARMLAENFRNRKRAEAAAAAATPESPPDIVINDHIENQSLDRTNSLEGRGSLHSTESWKTDEENNFDVPVHGVLNRGGEFRFDDTTKPLAVNGRPAGTPPFPTMQVESSRTMSSMSSVENDDPGANGRRQLSWKPAKEFSKKKTSTEIFEDNDDLSIDSENGSFRSKDRFDGGVSSGRASSTNGGLGGSKDGGGGSRSAGGGSRSGVQEQLALARLVASSEDYRSILVNMHEFPNSSVIQQEGLKHLSNLHLSDSEYHEVNSAGALQIVASAMRQHPTNLELQNCGCRAIWNFSATPKNQVSLVQEGALDCILTAMNNFSAEVELQEKALAALSNLGAAPQNQESIIRKRAIEKIVEVMNRHSEDGPVQSKACSALTNFASYDSPLKRQIMDLGGGGAVVICMIMHPEDIDLQEKALRALRNICANSDINKVEVARVGGIDAVISAMQVHRDEPGVQEAGAWTLSNLAVNPDNKKVIGDSGGIDVVIRAMWVHSDNVGVQEWCCRALWTLSVDGQNRQVMMEVGGISAVVNAMQAHADASTVQEKGCGVLSNLAASDDNSKIRIVEEEALDAIIMAMVLHSDNKAVQDRACSVLKRLAIRPNIKPMQAANVGELVRQAARKFPDKCQDKASAILAHL